MFRVFFITLGLYGLYVLIMVCYTVLNHKQA